MDGLVEVITGRERRRRWSAEQKLQIVSETCEPERASAKTQRDMVSARASCCPADVRPARGFWFRRTPPAPERAAFRQRYRALG